jgi:hypothetical protein
VIMGSTCCGRVHVHASIVDRRSEVEFLRLSALARDHKAATAPPG